MKLLRIHAPSRTARMELRLQSLRFRRLIETVSGLFDLLEDGREKLGGDYILDRHYVETLADEVVEKAGRAVFDACVLVAQGGEDLYAHYDLHRSRAHALLLSGGGHESFPYPGEVTGDAGLDPEYRLLADILNWIDGRQDGTGETLMGFILRVLDHAVTGIGELPVEGLEEEVFQCTAAGIRNAIRLVDTDADPAEPGDKPRDKNETGSGTAYRMLRLILNGTAGSDPQSKQSEKTRERNWLAVVDERHLSLRRIGTTALCRLEAYMEGTDGGDGMLFLFASHGSGLEARLPPEFRIERRGESVVAWLEDTRGEKMEDTLAQLSRTLFS